MEDQRFSNTMSNDNMSSSTHSGQASGRNQSAAVPKGFKLSGLEFGGRRQGGFSALESLGLEELIGATAFTNANLKASHAAPGAIAAMLIETMAKLEEKFQNNAFDAAAMPLVKQYLDEMKHLASLQIKRQELISQRITDIKEANKAAYQAVQNVRSEREAEIWGSSSLLEDEQRLASFRREQRKRIKSEARNNRRLMKELLNSDRLSVKRASQADLEQAKQAVYEQQEALAASQTAEQVSMIDTHLVEQRLHRAEVEQSIAKVELTNSRLAAEKAKEEYVAIQIEVAQAELQSQYEAAREKLQQSSEKLKKDITEATIKSQKEAQIAGLSHSTSDEENKGEKATEKSSNSWLPTIKPPKIWPFKKTPPTPGPPPPKSKDIPDKDGESDSKPAKDKDTRPNNKEAADDNGHADDKEPTNEKDSVKSKTPPSDEKGARPIDNVADDNKDDSSS